MAQRTPTLNLVRSKRKDKRKDRARTEGGCSGGGLALGGEKLGQLCQVAAEAVGEAAQSDGGEEVDGEAHVAGGVAREQVAKPLRQAGVLQPLVEAAQAHVLRQVLRRGGNNCVIFCLRRTIVVFVTGWTPSIS